MHFSTRTRRALGISLASLSPSLIVCQGSCTPHSIRSVQSSLHLPGCRRGAASGEAADAGKRAEQGQGSDKIVPHVPMLPEISRCLFPVENGNGATAAFVKKNGKIEARRFFK